MQIEAVRPRVTAIRRGRLDRLGRVPQTTKARAAVRSERHGPLRGLRAEGLEMIAHDLVERGLRGTPRFVGR